MKNNKKGFANIVLVGIIVALVAIGGYFAWSKKSEPITQQPTVTVTLKDETADWKTYTNTEYGFEFNYLPTYTVKSYSESTARGSLFGVILRSIAMGEVEGGYGPLAFISINVWDNSKELSLVNWASDEYNNSFSNYKVDGFADFKNQTLAGHKAISYSWEGLGYGKTVLIENEKMIFMLSGGADGAMSEHSVWQDFDGILSTFKFTE